MNGEGADVAGPDESRHAALVRLLRAIHVAATRVGDRRSAIGSIIGEVCGYMDWPLGHAHLYDASSGRLSPTMIWHERKPGRHGPLLDATASERFRPEQGIPGRAVASRTPQWVSDVSRDPAFLRGPAAEECGVRAGVWIPVFQNGDVAGVLEFFTMEPREPDDELLAVLEYVGMAWSSVLGLKHLAEELDEHAARFQALVESASDAIIVSNQQGRIVEWNRAARRIFGYDSCEALGQPLTMIMPDSYRERHRRAFAGALEREPGSTRSQVLEVEGLAKDGRRMPIELSLASWGTSRRYFAGIVRDISERRAAEEELRLIESATAHVRDAIVVSTAGNTGRGPTILYVNAAFSRMTGYSEADVLGRSFSLLAGPDTDRDLLRSIHERMSRGQPVAAELTAYRKDGTDFLLDWHASPIYEPDGTVQHVASIQRDITEERRVEQALRRVDRDPLTGLANRKIFERRLRRCIDRAAEREDDRYAVVFMDLDGFKEVNDMHGHILGDQLLTAVAGRLERTVRPGDTLARFGGDEFVILMSYVSDVSDVIMVADRVQERLSAPFDINGLDVRVAASVGIALSETGYTDPGEVLRDADAAMYEAKRRGKGRVEFHDRELYAEVVSQLGLQEDLKRCLEHDELGLILPERFIPLAEDSGAIVPMGRWILREACRTAHGWERSQPNRMHPTLSVNLSMRELSGPDVVDTVRSTLEETGLDPARLQLELTESVLVKSLGSLGDRVEALRALGIKVCIDEFGTGYSSLGYLRQFPASGGP